MLGLQNAIRSFQQISDRSFGFKVEFRIGVVLHLIWYNIYTKIRIYMGDRLMVGQQTLDLFIGVRIPVPQHN